MLQVVALHKDRYVFPCSLKVTRFSGTGVDSMFMGVLKVRSRGLFHSLSGLPSLVWPALSCKRNTVGRF